MTVLEPYRTFWFAAPNQIRVLFYNICNPRKDLLIKAGTIMSKEIRTSSFPERQEQSDGGSCLRRYSTSLLSFLSWMSWKWRETISSSSLMTAVSRMQMLERSSCACAERATAVGIGKRESERRRAGGGSTYVGGEVGHVGERDGGAVERALEDRVQRRLLVKRPLQVLHILLQLQPARRGGGAGRRLRGRGEPPPRLGERQRHGRPDGGGLFLCLGDSRGQRRGEGEER